MAKSKSGNRPCPTCGLPVPEQRAGLCPECGVDLHEGSTKPPQFFSVPGMRYPRAYTWLVLLSALDLILTGLALQFWGGEEINPFAAYVIDEFGFGWTIAFKFGMMLLAIMMCEFAGRRNDRVGRRLALACVLINAVPVVWTLCLLINAGAPVS